MKHFISILKNRLTDSSQVMAKRVVEMCLLGVSKMMPTVNAKVIGSLCFDEIKTDNTICEEDLRLADRIGVHIFEESACM